MRRKRLSRPLLLLLAISSVLLLGGMNDGAHAQPAPAQAPQRGVNDLRLRLPQEIPVVPGREANIYFDNIILCPIRWQDFFHVDVHCAKGQQQSERWTWTPTAEEVGVYPLTIRFYGPEDELLAEGRTQIRVYPAEAGAGQSVSLLIIGDSLTAAMTYTQELLQLTRQAPEQNPRLTLIGTNAPRPEDPALRNEGYGGWTAKYFATLWGPAPVNAQGRRARSPFLYEAEGKPRLDFQRYCDENNGGKGPDFITILLGCNDNFGATDETIEASIDEFFTYLDMLIAEFHRVRADTKIGIISLLPPAATQDAFGANYGCGQTRWQYRKNQHRVLEREMEKYAGREAENIFFVPAYVNLDCLRNYPVAEGPANARAEGPAGQIRRQTNGVHPAPSGYRQLADSLYCWLKSMLAR